MSVYQLADSYVSLLAWFVTGIPSPLLKQAYHLKDDIEAVLQSLTATQLTGIELVTIVKDKYRDALPEVSAASSTA